jgi:hypothetical protein
VRIVPVLEPFGFSTLKFSDNSATSMGKMRMSRLTFHTGFSAGNGAVTGTGPILAVFEKRGTI